MDTIREMADSEKPREKLMNNGCGSLSNQELIALLLHTGTKDQSAIRLAENLLNRFGGIEGLYDLSFEELISIKGIKMAKACTLLAAIALGVRVAQADARERIQLNDPETIANYFMPHLRYEPKEIFRILFLDTKNQMVYDLPVTSGILNASLVHPREVFREAIRRNVNAIVCVHNHPSGNPTPSPEDIAITRKLVDAGNIIGIKVLDHVIIGDRDYRSMRAMGLMD